MFFPITCPRVWIPAHASIDFNCRNLQFRLGWGGQARMMKSTSSAVLINTCNIIQQPAAAWKCERESSTHENQITSKQIWGRHIKYWTAYLTYCTHNDELWHVPGGCSKRELKLNEIYKYKSQLSKWNIREAFENETMSGLTRRHAVLGTVPNTWHYSTQNNL